MACVALTSLMATIHLEFLHPNHRVCLHDDKPLKSLLEKLSCLEAFLKKEYNNGGAPIRDLEIKIRDFALKAEDDIEIQLTNILQKAHEGELHQTLQQVAKDAEELLKFINNPSINEVEMGNESLPLIDWSEPGGSLQCSPQFEDTMVGLHSRDLDLKWMKKILLSDGIPKRSVASIFGPPGVGKTTLCKKLYTDERVVSYFCIRAWVTIPQRYNVQQLLCHLLQSMRPPINEIEMGSTVSQLNEQLHKHLKCKRYLIVLDDVPNTLVWDDIQQCFPNDSNGSRIFLTTLFSDVAKLGGLFCLLLRFLTDNESWDLFCHRFSHKQYMAPKFKEIAERLVEECKGLPRSIVTVANRLSKCNYTLKEWKRIEKELQSLGILHRDAQHLSKLTYIYNRLPQHLKVCFLYFAVFPKNSQIQVKKLIKLWIAEGFVKSERGLSLENIAYRYLGALRSRGLVILFTGKAFKPKT